MKRALTTARAAYARLDGRLSEIHPGLTLWSGVGNSSLAAHTAALDTLEREILEARAVLFGAEHATREALVNQVFEAQTRLTAILSKFTACLLLALILGQSLFSGDDDLIRRGPRSGKGRRRDDVVALADGETGEDLS